MSVIDKALDWAAYAKDLDCTASLSSAEKTALASWVLNPPAAPFVHEQDRAADLHAVHRFAVAVERVITYCGYDDPTRWRTYACTLLLLHTMHEQQATFWAWDEATWIRLLGNTRQDYLDGHSAQYALQAPRLAARLNLRTLLMDCAYFLGGVPIHSLVEEKQLGFAARRVFSRVQLDEAVADLEDGLPLVELSTVSNVASLKSCLCEALLLNRNPDLYALTADVIERVYTRARQHATAGRACRILARVLHELGILEQALSLPVDAATAPPPADTVSTRWQQLIEEFVAASFQQIDTRQSYRTSLRKIARWAAARFPQAADPENWTKVIVQALQTDLTNLRKHKWSGVTGKAAKKGQPQLSAGAKAQLFSTIRQFLAFCERSEVISKRPDLTRYLTTPKDIQQARRNDPRVLAVDTWAKLTEAGLSLTEADIPHGPFLSAEGKLVQQPIYPLELVQAVASVWLLGGLRNNEILRLAVGCVRAPYPATSSRFATEPLEQFISILRVPTHKTGASFEKPVDCRLGKALKSWEAMRSSCNPRIDRRGGQLVHFLFSYRGRVLPQGFINDTLIPLLCRKAGVDTEDSGLPITSHRARATLATQLYLAGLDLFAIQKWLGHRSLQSVLHYVKVTNLHVNASFARALGRLSSEPGTGKWPAPEQERVRPHSLYVEPVGESSPEHDLDHLRPRRYKAGYAQVVSAHNALTHLRRALDLPAADSQVLDTSLSLLQRWLAT
ncbi:hypothetical protein DNI29_22235 [Hymenobacter sediminis]|uniref:tyrosine-type recombinase/integrase n=1 Tax=Hymenobacter sediminis TaxID=2218621 RepID=UPI000DA6D420|nr:tyrosine-type recombinase/integrase [Hymenobacter sediminis]RPD44119.1 hypothetical protein DNI29_22235 [Hymenobacter sediminis]